MGVAIVGGGPGGLACAIRLTQLLAEDEALSESLGEVPVALVEKGKGPGSHLLSGAMMNPSAMRKLFPDLPESEWPTYGAVEKDTVYLLPNRKRAIPLKPTPPPFRNHGNHVTSVAQLGRWLSDRAEEAGVYILGETVAAKLLVEDGRVVGVRSGDKGRGKEGEELGNFEPGSDLIAQATVLAEGTQGHLTGAAIRHFELGSEDPQQWELGVKEVWEVPQPLDRVIHTMGWPLRFGRQVPRVRRLVHLPDGRGPRLDRASWWGSTTATPASRSTTRSRSSRASARREDPRGRQACRLGGQDDPLRRLLGPCRSRYWAPGLAIAGDGAGMVNIPKLKGVHYAMHAGMFAAEAIYERLKAGVEGTADLSNYEHEGPRLGDPEGHPPLAQHAPALLARLPRRRRDRQHDGDLRRALPRRPLDDPRRRHRGRLHGDRDKRYPKPDGKPTFDKLSSVFLTGNATRDDAPNHIRIQDKVPLELALMWQNMCPAAVYEVPEEEIEAPATATAQAASSTAARGQAADHSLELRAVRRDHRQGRPADAARGRRRPELPGHLTLPGKRGAWKFVHQKATNVMKPLPAPPGIPFGP